MEKQYNLNFKSLKENIIDVIKEEQIKLGYRKETIRLYYPMESINNLLEDNVSISKLQDTMDNFCLYVKDILGEVEYSYDDKRLCIMIPPSGVEYVHEAVEERHFLRAFIEKISEHHCGINELLAVFQRYSKRVVCNKVTNGEFDYLIYFEDGNPDLYRYCIKFEDCHAIYHRFTISDYESFGF